MQSIESTALEPTRGELAGLASARRSARYLPVYGLVILTVLLIVLFSILLPQTFPTLLNLRSIISDKAIIALLSLAAMIPMASGRIDLTVGYGIVLWHILAISLQTMFGVPWPIAVADRARCSAPSPASSTACWSRWRGSTASSPRSAPAPCSTRWRSGTPAAGRWSACCRRASTRSTAPWCSACRSPASTCWPSPSLLWLVLEYLPIGRYLYAIGANPKAAALNGIPVRRFVIGAFVASGALTALAGVLLASKLRIGQASVGLEYLLPALVGAFLGSTTIKPGRVNVWGTMIGVIILAVGISGIQQFGGSFFVEPLFNGVTLLVAIGIAGYAQRKRGRGRSGAPGMPQDTKQLADTDRANRTIFKGRKNHETQNTPSGSRRQRWR